MNHLNKLARIGERFIKQAKHSQFVKQATKTTEGIVKDLKKESVKLQTKAKITSSQAITSLNRWDKEQTDKYKQQKASKSSNSSWDFKDKTRPKSP